MLCSALIGVVIIGVVSFVIMKRARTDIEKNGSICCVAGKSGGHLIPALTLARQYREKHPSAHVLFFSTDTPLDRHIVQKSGIVSEYIPLSLGNVPRWAIWRWPGYFWDLAVVSWQAWRALLKARPEEVLTTGGFISLPVGIIARLLGIPVYLYELNAVPGKAAIFLSLFATRTFVCFDEAAALFPLHAYPIRGPYPLRFGKNDRLSKDEARRRLGIGPDVGKVLLVIGGSQGSFFINTIIPQVMEGVAALNAKNVFVMHQTGAHDVERVQALYKNAGVSANVFAFREDMEVLYSAADCAISRAGAGSLFELLFFEKPSIIIPLETVATDHQLDNGRAMERQYPQFFSVLRQGDIENSPKVLEQRLRSLLA